MTERLMDWLWRLYCWCCRKRIRPTWHKDDSHLDGEPGS
jgi:hypothetical protein